MRPSPPLPPKKEVALALLAHSSVLIHLDPRVANVVVPSWFKKQSQLVLQVGLNMPVPIHDLHLDDDGLSCTLSFNRSPFHCMIPWTAVYAMVDDEARAMVWPDDVPAEMKQQVRVRAVEPEPSSEASPEPAPAAGKKEPAKRPKLAEVRSGDGAAAAAPKKGRGKAGKSAPTADAGSRLSAVPSRSRGGEATNRTPEKLTPVRPAPVEESPSSGGGGGQKPSPRPAPGRKQKRELPPYLRVVK